MNATFVTQPYKTGSGDYIRTVAVLWTARWWWTIALPITTCFILATTINIAFAFVALMILFIIIPMIMSFLYFYYALTPEAIMAMRNKRLHIVPDKHIIVNYETATGDDDISATLPPSEIKWNEITGIEYRNHDMMLHLSGSRYRFLLIPYESIGDYEQQSNLANILSSFDKST